MTGPASSRARRSHRRRPLVRALLLTAAFGIVFALGVALGQATSSDTRPGAELTRVKTVVPIAATRETVTVTETVAAEP